MPKQNRQPGIHLHRVQHVRGLGEWYWILIARNGKTIARSSETYKTKRSAVKSIEVAAGIITGHKPIEYYDHTLKNGGNWVEF